METFKIKIGQLKNADYNPRIIDTFKYESLKKSLLELPDMLEVRPLIIDEDFNIIAGNMRYQACMELGYKEVYVKQILDLSDDEKKELMVKDNISYGEWDEQILGDNFNSTWVNEWLGREVVDYSILMNDDISEKIDLLYDNIKKSVHIKINGNFEQAQALEKRFKERKIYIGQLLIDKLKDVKQAYEKN
jgi:ParB-like chromosome segregation protein Spo0J